MSPKKSIRVESLNYTYEEATSRSLKDISFSVEQSQLIIILGGTKSGKTSLLYTLSGIIPNFLPGTLTGDIHLNGVEIEGLEVNEICSHFGLVFQNFSNQLFSTDCLSEVAFFPENLGYSRDEIKANIEYSLKKAGLEGFINRNPRTLSGGEKQKLAIASILSGRVPIVGFDEARTDLDPIASSEIGNLFKELTGDEITVISAEEEVDITLDGDLYLLLNEGRVVKSGNLQDISTSPLELIEMGVKPSDYSFISTDITFTDIEQAYDYLLSKEVIYRGPPDNKTPEPTSSSPRVIIQDLSHSYESGADVLKDVNLTVYENEWLSVLGENGSGKTTLARCISGLIHPTSGKVYIDGERTAEIEPDRMVKKVGYLFQDPDHQIFCETVFDEVAFGLKHQNIKSEQIERSVMETLSYLNLEDAYEEDPYSLSKGERQKIALASILVFEPEILILDEPTTGLDYEEIRNMLKKINELNMGGTTIITITHSMWFASETSDRIVVLKDGEVALTGTPETIFNKGDILHKYHIIAPEIVELSIKLGRFTPSIIEFLKNYTWRDKPEWKVKSI